MMLQIRKLAVLATLVALVAAPAGAKDLKSLPISIPTANAPGPFSETISCGTGAPMLYLGVRTFNLTDVTIANADELLHTVGIFNSTYGGVQYALGGGSTVTQKFETPIRFIGAINSPYLWCDGPSPYVTVSIQGTIQ